MSDDRDLHVARAVGEYNAYMRAVGTDQHPGDPEEAALAEQAMHAHLRAAREAREAD